MTDTDVDVSVVLPVHRTAAYIDPLYRLLDAALADQGRVELVFVDDASPDNAQQQLAALATRDPRVRVVSLRDNQGQQRATLHGLAVCRGQVVVVMDADLQDRPEALPALLDHLRTTGADAVFAVRHNSYASRGRRMTGRVFKWCLRRLAPVPPGAGSYMLLRRPLVERILALPGSAPYMVGMVCRTARRVATVEVPRAPRPDGVSAWTSTQRLRVALRALYDVAFTWRT